VSRIRWTTPSADQLADIVKHIQEDNPDAARKVAQSIFDSIAKLEVFPNLGRPGEQEGTRELVFSPFVIVYRLKDDVAEILYIWHGAQDWR
jgi:plasmid stabilization system protein ParE